MGLISRVSSRTYREVKFTNFLKMSVLSKPLFILGSSTTLFTVWALWYDHYRRSRPDYKSKLVQKRKQQLLEYREANDPLSYIKKIPLPEKATTTMELQKFQMEQLQKGELMLGNPAETDNGCAHIAMGLGFMDARRASMVLQQLHMSLPAEIIEKIRFYLRTAQARFEKQILDSIMTRNKPTPKQEEPVLKEIKQNPNQEPEDVDSIDGDSDEKIEEIEVKNLTQLEPIQKDDFECEQTRIPSSPELKHKLDDLVEDEISDSEDESVDQENGDNEADDIELSKNKNVVDLENVVGDENENPVEEVQSEILTKNMNLPCGDNVVENKGLCDNNE